MVSKALRNAKSTFFCCSPLNKSASAFGTKHPWRAQAMPTMPVTSQAFDASSAFCIAWNVFSQGAFYKKNNRHFNRHRHRHWGSARKPRTVNRWIAEAKNVKYSLRFGNIPAPSISHTSWSDCCFTWSALKFPSATRTTLKTNLGVTVEEFHVSLWMTGLQNKPIPVIFPIIR